MAGEAHNAGKACIIVVNKWDLVEKDGSTMKEYTLAVSVRVWHTWPYCYRCWFIPGADGQRVG